MCGISGFFEQGLTLEEVNRRLRAMEQALGHRGPDGAGTWHDARHGVALAHRRLAIVDLSPRGAQPMSSASGRMRVVFNGEIYNHRELRSELRDLGHVFQSETDTEVLLAAMEQWGLKQALSRFAGMFAFGLWDQAEGTLSLAVDRLGEKPLHFVVHPSRVAFASELKGLLPLFPRGLEISTESVAEFLSQGYINAPRSIYQQVRKVCPGTFVQFRLLDRGAPYRVDSYWSVEDALQRARAAPFRGSPEDAVEELDELLREAVELQMVADVPVGAFLSGGVDSSTIVAMMQRKSSRAIKTFAIGFAEQEFNEAQHARRVAAHLGTDHAEIVVTSGDALNALSRLGEIFDEPFADPSQIPTFLVAQLARQKVTVSLSGDAGDELFLGYKNYAHVHHVWRASRWLPRRARTAAAALGGRLAGIRALSVAWRHRLEQAARMLPADSAVAMHRQLTTAAVARDLLVHTPGRSPEASVSDAADLTELGAYDLRHYLPGDILVKIDRAAMAVSLESRIPMLDHRVVEFALRLPDEIKFREGRGKWVLRRVLQRYVPTALVDRPKQGFAVPIARWLRGPLREWAESLLKPETLEAGGLQVGEVKEMWRRHVAGMPAPANVLWSTLIYLHWLSGRRGRNRI